MAVLRDGVVEDVAIERPGRPDGLGDLHRARVSAVSRPMSGAFLLLADGATAFLPESEQPDRRLVHEGALVTVRITRAAQGGKGPRVTARLPARDAAASDTVVLLRRGPDAALRFAALRPDAPLITDDAAEAARLRAVLGAARVTLDRAGAFDDGIETVFDVLAGPEVPLDGGGRLTIHPTPALTAIDIDTGGSTAGPAAWNAMALAEAARQIRLRALGGAILVDVAGLGVAKREGLAAGLAEVLATDPVRPRLLGLTRLGLFEIQRSRTVPPLHEVLGTPPSALTHGLAALRRAMRDSAAAPGRALALRATPAVLAALEAQPGALEAFARDAGRKLTLRPDGTLPPGREAIEPA